MDNIFGIGLPEFVLILVIAGMVMGPERILRTARSLGRLTAKLQTISRTFFRQLNAELDSFDQDGQLKSTVEELNQLRRQVADLRSEVFTLTTGAAGDSKKAVADLRREFENSILPPSLAEGLKNNPATPRPATQPTTVTANSAPVYQPPSLLPPTETAPGPDAGANGPFVAMQAMKLPRRVEVREDPDE
jgi:Sec-independent protein translocase protein TatA